MEGKDVADVIYLVKEGTFACTKKFPKYIEMPPDFEIRQFFEQNEFKRMEDIANVKQSLRMHNYTKKNWETDFETLEVCLNSAPDLFGF